MDGIIHNVALSVHCQALVGHSVELPRVKQSLFYRGSSSGHAPPLSPHGLAALVMIIVYLRPDVSVAS